MNKPKESTVARSLQQTLSAMKDEEWFCTDRKTSLLFTSTRVDATIVFSPAHKLLILRADGPNKLFVKLTLAPTYHYKHNYLLSDDPALCTALRKSFSLRIVKLLLDLCFRFLYRDHNYK